MAKVWEVGMGWFGGGRLTHRSVADRGRTDRAGYRPVCGVFTSGRIHILPLRFKPCRRTGLLRSRAVGDPIRATFAPFGLCKKVVANGYEVVRVALFCLVGGRLERRRKWGGRSGAAGRGRRPARGSGGRRGWRMCGWRAWCVVVSPFSRAFQCPVSRYGPDSPCNQRM